MTQYEYVIETIDPEINNNANISKLQETLQLRGLQGWELVSAFHN